MVGVKKLQSYPKFAKTQPHAAFSAYIHGQQHRFTYFLRTIEGMENYLKPLQDAISNILLPAIFGSTVNKQQRELHSLPIKSGSLGFANLTERAAREYETSRLINAPLIAIMMFQETNLPNETERKNVVREQSSLKIAALNKKSKKLKNRCQKTHYVS